MPINRYGWLIQRGPFDALDGDSTENQWQRRYINNADEQQGYTLPLEDCEAFVAYAAFHAPYPGAAGESVGTSSATLAGVTGTTDADAVAGGASDRSMAGVTGTTDADVIAGGTSSQTLAGASSTAGAGGVTAAGTSSQTLAGTSGSASGGSGNTEWARVSSARFETPPATPPAVGTSSQTLAGAGGLAFGGPLSIGTSSASMAGATGSASGGIASTEWARVSAAFFLTPKAPPAPATGTSSQTLAGVTGVAFGGGTAVEWARVSAARFEAPSASEPHYVDPPMVLNAITITVSLSGTFDIVPGLYGTSAKTLAGVSGSADGSVGVTPSGSIRPFDGVGGSATGSVVASGTSSTALAGVAGFADTVPTVVNYGASTSALDGVAGSADSIAVIGGFSNQSLAGVFAGIGGNSDSVLAGVRGAATGGLRVLVGRRMRTPGTQSIQQIRAK